MGIGRVVQTNTTKDKKANGKNQFTDHPKQQITTVKVSKLYSRKSRHEQLSRNREQQNRHQRSPHLLSIPSDVELRHRIDWLGVGWIRERHLGLRLHSAAVLRLCTAGLTLLGLSLERSNAIGVEAGTTTERVLQSVTENNHRSRGS